MHGTAAFFSIGTSLRFCCAFAMRCASLTPLVPISGAQGMGSISSWLQGSGSTPPVLIRIRCAIFSADMVLPGLKVNTNFQTYLAQDDKPKPANPVQNKSKTASRGGAGREAGGSGGGGAPKQKASFFELAGNSTAKQTEHLGANVKPAEAADRFACHLPTRAVRY